MKIAPLKHVIGAQFIRRAGMAFSMVVALAAQNWASSAQASPLDSAASPNAAGASAPALALQPGSDVRGAISLKKASRAHSDPDRGPAMQSQFDAAWAKGRQDAGLEPSGGKNISPAVSPAAKGGIPPAPKAPAGFSDRSVMAFPYGADPGQTVDFYVSAQPIPDAPLAFLVPAAAGPSEAQSPAERAALVAQARHWTDEGFVAVVGWRRAGSKASPAEQAKDVAAGFQIAQKNARMVNLDPARTVVVGEGAGAKLAIDALAALGADKSSSERDGFAAPRALILAGGENLSGAKAEGVKTLSTGSLPASAAAIDQFVSGLGL